MSSHEEEYNDADNFSAQGLKKRRIQRACDICRRKKSMLTRSESVLKSLNRISSSMLVSFSSRLSGALIFIIGDGVQMPGNRCSNCVSYSLDCTYVEASKVWFCVLNVAQCILTFPQKRGPPKGWACCIILWLPTWLEVRIKLCWKPRESCREVG